MKRLRVIAGPNGSGKTTLYLELLKNGIPLYDFINADEIKLHLEKERQIQLPFDLESGELAETVSKTTFSRSVKQLFCDGRISSAGNIVRFSQDSINAYSVAAFADFLRTAYLKRGKSFTVETVFSHPSKLQFLSNAQKQGYRIYLYLIATDDPQLNVKRVQQRVDLGGHDVPEATIISRYSRCLENFYPALDFAFRAYFWDNSAREMRLFAELKPDHSLETVGNIPKWFSQYILKKTAAED